MLVAELQTRMAGSLSCTGSCAVRRAPTALAGALIEAAMTGGCSVKQREALSLSHWWSGDSVLDRQSRAGLSRNDCDGEPVMYQLVCCQAGMCNSGGIIC